MRFTLKQAHVHTHTHIGLIHTHSQAQLRGDHLQCGQNLNERKPKRRQWRHKSSNMMFGFNRVQILNPYLVKDIQFMHCQSSILLVWFNLMHIAFSNNHFFRLFQHDWLLPLTNY